MTKQRKRQHPTHGRRQDIKLKWHHKLTLAIVIVIVGVAVYGWVTDCSGTSGYSYCSPAERHYLKFGR